VSDHGSFLISGHRWFCHLRSPGGGRSRAGAGLQAARRCLGAHRSRHCLPTRPGRSAAITDHFFGPNFATSSRTLESSCRQAAAVSALGRTRRCHALPTPPRCAAHLRPPRPFHGDGRHVLVV
jgi:hypothetical protein